MSVRRIAEQTGVSIATVSRVINQSDKVKEETRRKVEQAMKEMNIDPNDLVRSAKRRSNKAIGVVVPDIGNQFFAQVIKGIQMEADYHGVQFFICDTDEDDQHEIRYLRLLREAQVNGVIITPASDDDDSVNNEYLNLLTSMKIPIVLVDRDVKYTNYAGVFIDNLRGAFDATSLLFQNGHTRIAIIAGPVNSKPGRERLMGYREAFAAHAFPVDEALIYYGDFRMPSGYSLTRQILREHRDVTAVLSCNNLMTLGCLQYLNERGLSIPHDLSLVGFDEVEPLEMLGITVVGRPTYEMGRLAMEFMAESMFGNAKRPIRRMTLMPELIIRGSERMPDRV